MPKIDRTPDVDGNTEVELITAFAIKLREHNTKELTSKDVKYSSLQALISAAEHFELHLPSLTLASTNPVENVSTWESAVNYYGSFLVDPAGHNPETLVIVTMPDQVKNTLNIELIN